MTIYILSSKKKTGGTFLLHQLGACLNGFGHEVIFDYGDPNCTQSIYFDFKISSVKDLSNNTVIIPEIYSSSAKKFHNATVYIWWLSVDNFFRQKRENVFIDFVKSLSSLCLGKRSSLRSLRKYNHLTQSYYAKNFLSNHSISSVMLSDYLDEKFLTCGNASIATGNRRNRILYNPSKGRKITRKIISYFPNLNFVPLIDFTPSQLHDLMCSSKLYIDFGHHPGKDRMPREAVISGCCLITGISGSAFNSYDIPTGRFKLNPIDDDFYQNFGLLVSDIFNNFDVVSLEFEAYRNIIANEKNVFDEQVAKIFNE